MKNEVFLTDLMNAPVTFKNVREQRPILSLIVKYLHCVCLHDVKYSFDPCLHRKLEMIIEQSV